MPIPDWITDAFFYQIFPDRFANGNPANDPQNVKSWGSQPSFHGYMGGDLAGITQKLDYLLDLGVNAIYLNPIFLAASTHRYNTTDYYKIDPLLGSKEDFDNLIKCAHARSIRIILDGVFNHCGRGFFAFNDVIENQQNSAYVDWFHISKFPVDAYTPGDAQEYLGWWKHKSLPKFNTTNPSVRRFLLDVGKYWIQQGADGWRLDVPNEIDDDTFWAEFREEVRKVNPNAYLLGEIWEVAPRWVGDSHFDGLMNYPLRSALLELLEGRIPPLDFTKKINQINCSYPQENLSAMYSLLGSHDTERILTLLQGDLEKLKAAYTLLFTLPGCPSIYYGDEIGMEGAKDPDSRRAFPWNVQLWKPEIRDFVKMLARLRVENPELKRGGVIFLDSPEYENLVAFTRILGDEKLLVIANTGNSFQTVKFMANQIEFSADTVLYDLLGLEDYRIDNGVIELRMPAHSSKLLKQKMI